MQNFIHYYGWGIRTEGVLRLPCSASFDENVVDARDVAAVAAECLATDRFEGRALTLTGPEPRTYPSMVAAIARVAARPVTFETVSPEVFRAAMLPHAVTPEHVDGIVAMLRFHEEAAARSRAPPSSKRRACARVPSMTLPPSTPRAGASREAGAERQRRVAAAIASSQCACDLTRTAPGAGAAPSWCASQCGTSTITMGASTSRCVPKTLTASLTGCRASGAPHWAQISGSPSRACSIGMANAGVRATKSCRTATSVSPVTQAYSPHAGHRMTSVVRSSPAITSPHAGQDACIGLSGASL
jgi:hypothetical protein